MLRFGAVYLKNKYNSSLLDKFIFFIIGYPNIGVFIKSRSFINFIKKNKFRTILDAGCSDGIYMFYLANKYPNSFINGIDINKSALKQGENLKDELNLSKVRFDYIDIEKLHIVNKYDVVYSIHTLYYLKNKKRAIHNIYNSLTDKGKFYLNIPTKDWAKYCIFNSKIFTTYLKHRDQEHVGEKYYLSEIKNVVQRSGFRIIKSKYHFWFLSRLCWEVDFILSAKEYTKTRIILLPLLKIICVLDNFIRLGKPIGIIIVGEK